MKPFTLLACDDTFLDWLPTDDEVVSQILAAGQPFHFVFTPRAAKNAFVRFGNTGSNPIVAKKWEVTPKVAGVADVTNFEGLQVPSAAGAAAGNTGLLVEQKLACTVTNEFTIDTDADGAQSLYTAGMLPGNSATELRLYLNGISAVSPSGPYWSFPTPYFASVPMTADVKTSLQHRITGEGSGFFVYPLGVTF